MALRTVLKYGAIAIAALLVVSVAVSVASAIVGLLWSLVTTAVTLLAVGALLYGGYSLYSWLSDDDSGGQRVRDRSTGVRADGTGADGVDRLRERYANGDLSEAELERRLERELDGTETDSIDRELRRERN